MDVEKAKQQASLAVTLVIAGIVSAVVAGVVLFLGPLSTALKLNLIDPSQPRPAWLNIANIALAVLAAGAAFVGTRLASRAKEVILPGQAGRKQIETSAVLGWAGAIAGGWFLLYLLGLLAPQSKVQLLLGLGEVGQTLLIILLAAAIIAAFTYLVLGVVFTDRRWTTVAAILHLVSGALGIVAGVFTLINVLFLVEWLAPFHLDVSSLQGKEMTFGLIALLYGAFHAVTGLLLLTRLGQNRWVHTVSALLNLVGLAISLYLAGTALGQQAWLIVLVAIVSFVLGGIAISAILPPTKTRFALPFVLLSPAIVGLCLLVIYPMGYEIRLAFSNMSLKHFKDPTYSLAEGFSNFAEVFNQPVLKQVYFLPLFLRTLLWTAIQVPFHVLGGLVLALLLNRPMRLRGLYRALLVIPWALPPIVAVLAWRGEFHFEYGFINIMLKGLGLAAVQWKSDPTANFIAMNIVNIWLGIPFMMVILLGGLQSIPTEMYEAAEIDGATWWQQFRKITMPLLQPVLTPAIILGVIWTFNNFNVPFFINENELETSDILVTALFRSAFEYNQYGFAAAFALVIFAILLVFSVFYINFSGSLRAVSESAPKPRRKLRRALSRGAPKGGSEQ